MFQLSGFYCIALMVGYNIAPNLMFDLVFEAERRSGKGTFR